jgi:hypothetical protein
MTFGFDLARKLQEVRGTRACIPVPVIDRKLLKCDFVDFAQLYHALHPLPGFKRLQISQIQTDFRGAVSCLSVGL